MRAHADDLRAEVADDTLVDAIARDWRAAETARISERAPVLCAHAEALTRAPASIDEAAIGRLRDAGCDDDTILDVTQVVALFGYFNRIADGLGIDPEPDWD